MISQILGVMVLAESAPVVGPDVPMHMTPSAVASIILAALLAWTAWYDRQSRRKAPPCSSCMVPVMEEIRASMEAEVKAMAELRTSTARDHALTLQALNTTTTAMNQLQLLISQLHGHRRDES
jgi:hypothetical protein